MELGSRVVDYREIFARSGTSSIPMLDVPELNERNACVDLRGSRPDYTKIFGGFGEADFAMPCDELISRAEKEMKSSRPARASANSRSQLDEPTFAERTRMSAEASVQSLDGRKHVNVSYHKTNSGVRMGRGGMTHIAQLHAVPGYSRLIDENVSEDMKEDRSHKKAYSGPLLFSNGSRQHGEHRKTFSSMSNDVSFDVHRDAHPPGISSSPSSPLSLGNEKGITSNRSMKSKLGIQKSTGGSYSPPILDDEVNANSTAATSAAAVRKAIDEAQAKIKFAKALMERKKEGRHNRSRGKVNYEVTYEKREAKSAEKTCKYKEDTEESYVRDDMPKKQDPNATGVEDSAEAHQVIFDLRDETEDFNSRPGNAVNTDKEATSTDVDCKLKETKMSKSLQEYPEATISSGDKPSTLEFEQEVKVKKVTPSSFENKWKEKMKASVLQNKFENIMKMLRGPADIPEVEVQLPPAKNLGGLDKDLGEIGSEEKQGATWIEEGVKGGSNEGIAREEDESTVKVNSWLNDIEKVQKEHVDDEDVGKIEKNQSVGVRKYESFSTSGEICAGETLQVQFGQFELQNAGEDTAAVNDREEVKETLEKGQENKIKIEEDEDEDDGINGSRGGQEKVSEHAETERAESDIHQKSEDEESDTQEIPRVLTDNIEVAPSSHNPDKGDSVDKIYEAHSFRELDVRVSDKTNTSSGPKQIGKESENSEEADNSVEGEDSARFGRTTSFSGGDRIGEQRDEQDERPEPLIVDENGVCSSGVSFKFDGQQTEDSATISEETCCPEKYVVEEATKRSEEVKEKFDDAEVGSTGEAANDSCTSLCDEKVSLDGECRENHVEGATCKLEEPDKDTVINNRFLDEERCCEDEIGTSTSQKSTVPEKEEPAGVSSNEKTGENVVDETEVTHDETQQSRERVDKHSPQKDVEMERQQRSRKKEVANEKDLEMEKQRIVVERAIREARERAFAEAREKADKAAAERDTAEAQRRAKAAMAARERSGRANAAEKAATEARLKAERAAVERATAEARERALEKALSDKASHKGRNYTDKSPATFKEDRRPSTTFFQDQRYKSSASSPSSRYPSTANNAIPMSTDISGGANVESSHRSKASLEKQQKMAERAAKALAEKNMRDLLVQKEQAEKNRLAEILDAEIRRWSSGKERNLRVLLSTLHYILGPDSGWQAIPRTDLNSATAVRKAYKKATLFVHPDKLQQRGASIRHKYVCEKVFELLKDAWNRFSADDR
ncbi:Auxilin-like protein 1 [Linum grandiflorum]